MTDTNHTGSANAMGAALLLGDLLDEWLKLAEKLRKATAEDDWETATRLAGRQVDLFGTAYMLAVVRHLDPVRADRAAEFLATMWDDGEMGELVYGWRQQLAAGKPLSLFVDNAEEVPTS